MGGILSINARFYTAVHGAELESLCPSTTRASSRAGSLRAHAEAGMQPAGVHILRHTAAKLRRDAGESIEDVSRFLDHSSLAVTTTYLRRLEGQEDLGWGAVAKATGIGREGAPALDT
jgi:integrase